MTTTYKPHPLRVQRRKGERLKPCECWVGSGRWGNYFDTAEEFESVFKAIEQSQMEPHEFCSETWGKVALIVRDIKQLRGFKLACSCLLDHSCHADVLAREANK